MGSADEPTPVGGYILADEPVEINVGRPRTILTVRNTGDRPIQVGSHFHFFEVNRALEFDRAAALGQRLDIPAGAGIRFEPGDEQAVTLVPVGGTRYALGFNNLLDGPAGDDAADRPRQLAAIARATELGYKSRVEPGAAGNPGTAANPGTAGTPGMSREGSDA
jgi:urease subunit beta